jgi:penicillin-binding protein 1A
VNLSTKRSSLRQKRAAARAIRHARPLRILSIWRLLALLLLYLSFAGAGFIYFGYRTIAATLPQDIGAFQVPPSKATLVFSADGELIGEFYLQNRIVVGIEQIPDHVTQAFIAAEDGRFWEHPGFDPLGIARAAISNMRGSGSKQGASTLTQQLTRMLLLSNERTYYRKMRELLLSVRVEQTFSKRTILEMYLNRVYLGHGSYGVQAASQGYFGKDVAELSIAEAAMLAGLVQRPSDYSPFKHLSKAKARQHYVLERMRIDGYISPNQQQTEGSQSITLVESGVPLNHLAAPYFVEHIRKWASTSLGQERLYDGGLRIYTTLDTRMQNSAEAALRDGLEALDRRIGFRAPIGHLDEEALAKFRQSPPKPYLPGLESVSLSENAQLLEDVPYIGTVVELPHSSEVKVAVGQVVWDMDKSDARQLRRWHPEPATPVPGAPTDPNAEPPARELRVGDQLPVKLGRDKRDDEVLLLSQVPDVQAAMIVMDAHTGSVRAMVGGLDYRDSEFNRATQAKRQIGSAFKPIIYATAMSKGVTQLDHVQDSPVQVKTSSGIWAPKNYDGKYLGSITLRTALAKSLNTVSVRLVLRVGVDAVINMARKLGVVSAIPRSYSIALGTPDLTLLEIVSVYAAFANGGKRIPTQAALPGPTGVKLPGRFVERVTTDTGKVVADYRNELPSEQVISPSLAYLVVDLMRGVVERGTGRHAQALGRPTAAKTGTSTEWHDAWFLGYTNDLLAGVWVGRDDFTEIGARATGGTAALPIWLQFMEAAHPPTEVTEFPVPPDVVLVRANELTGMPAGANAANSRLVPFLRGTVPPRFSAGNGSERFDRTLNTKGF